LSKFIASMSIGTRRRIEVPRRGWQSDSERGTLEVCSFVSEFLPKLTRRDVRPVRIVKAVATPHENDFRAGDFSVTESGNPVGENSPHPAENSSYN
jgi:hypothetical protein